MQIRPHLESLPPYIPIEPYEVLSARLGRSAEEIIKLDANENPYGMLPAVRKALANIPFPHIYPDPESRALREKLSEFTGVPMENILAGAGADELIDLLMRVFVDAGDRIVICPPTFGMYAFDGRLNQAQVIEVFRKADFSVDVDGIRQAVQQYAPKLLFLATPNNPDGSFISSEELEKLLELPTLVVLDEAYIEFVDHDGGLGKTSSSIGRVCRQENLAVLRTFSKWAGLAGLRVGYGAFPNWLMPTLWKAKQPYNLNVAASSAAIAALECLEKLKAIVARMIAERERMYVALQQFSFLRVYPSKANFLLMRVHGKDAGQLKQRLAEEFGILVRYFKTPGLEDCIRISVGKPEHTEALLRAFETLSREFGNENR